MMENESSTSVTKIVRRSIRRLMGAPPERRGSGNLPVVIITKHFHYMEDPDYILPPKQESPSQAMRNRLTVEPPRLDLV